jgi:hypothetical protein
MIRNQVTVPAPAAVNLAVMHMFSKPTRVRCLRTSVLNSSGNPAMMQISFTRQGVRSLTLHSCKVADTEQLFVTAFIGAGNPNPSRITAVTGSVEYSEQFTNSQQVALPDITWQPGTSIQITGTENDFQMDQLDLWLEIFDEKP